MPKENIINLSNWVELYTNELYNRAVYKVSNSELAKDLVQDTFLAAAEKIAAFKGDSSPKTWLFAILNHKIIDYYRKKINKPILNTDLSLFFNENEAWKTEKKPNNWQDDEINLLEDDDFQAILKKCLDALPEQWNTCVKLKYLMSKDGKEICQELEISPSNYWQIIHRAKVQLRDCVETNWFKN